MESSGWVDSKTIPGFDNWQRFVGVIDQNKICIHNKKSKISYSFQKYWSLLFFSEMFVMQTVHCCRYFKSCNKRQNSFSKFTFPPHNKKTFPFLDDLDHFQYVLKWKCRIGVEKFYPPPQNKKNSFNDLEHFQCVSIVINVL